MKKYKGSVSTNKVGSACEFEFEVEDNATEEEIEAEARDAAFQFVDWNFHPVED